MPFVEALGALRLLLAYIRADGETGSTHQVARGVSAALHIWALFRSGQGKQSMPINHVSAVQGVLD
jgi:hypothetical protein